MTSFFFTFLNLVEFCLILAISKYMGKVEELSQPGYFFRNIDAVPSKKRTPVEVIELCSKVAIPAGYALFVSIFLVIYLGGEDDQTLDGRVLVPLQWVKMKL